MMIYSFRCQEHGYFEVEQPMHGEHKAKCLICGLPADRVWSTPKWYYDHPKPLFNKDGSYDVESPQSPTDFNRVPKH